eukprot:658577-Amphidinium_carterae.1
MWGFGGTGGLGVSQVKGAAWLRGIARLVIVMAAFMRSVASMAPRSLVLWRCALIKASQEKHPNHLFPRPENTNNC